MATAVPEPTVRPVLHYYDAAAALRFLVDAFGFRAALTARDPEGNI